jgi:hypothetical protein
MYIKLMRHRTHKRLLQITLQDSTPRALTDLCAVKHRTAAQSGLTQLLLAFDTTVQVMTRPLCTTVRQSH